MVGLYRILFKHSWSRLLKNLYKKININVKKTVCIVLVCLYLIDLGYSHFHPNTGVGITNPVKVNMILELKK